MRAPAAARSSATLRDDAPLARAEGLELLGAVPDSGYEDGAALVRRPDGQMVQLGPLVYALLEEVDGERGSEELSQAMCRKLGRACDESHVAAIARRLSDQGLLAGSESNAPARSNPLLALRWKLVVTDPALTRRLTTPFLVLFRPALIVAVLIAFAAVCWFVLVEKGMASAAAQAFDRPEMILLVFALGIASAGFHELGHAAACRYGGGTPGAMGAGVYMVWPAFYTDVTDAYRLPRRARLRTDLGGLYFNALVAVATIGAWWMLRMDALLLLVGLQLVEMVKQLSPVIRADGYHILADATGVPDLYAHIGPTLRRLVPGAKAEPSALTGRARFLVTAWVLVTVPILLALTLSVVLLLPRLLASAWASGSELLDLMGFQIANAHVVELLVSALRLFALTLPVLGAGYIVWRLARGAVRRAAAWSAGQPRRRAMVVVLAALGACLLLASWWPSGQYEPIRASDRGALSDLPGLLVSERTAASTPAPIAARPAAARIKSGTHVAVSLIPKGGATDDKPGIFIIDGAGEDGAPVVITSTTTPTPSDASAPDAAAPATTDTSSPTPEPTTTTTTTATAFPFDLPDAPAQDDSQALAVNRTDGGTTYSIAYSLVTVRDGDPVDQRNGAHAYANCDACTTVAVSFQVVLVVGESKLIAPINIAEALNGNCPACITTAIAHQIVVSIGEEPSAELLEELTAELERLDALDDLGPDATPAQLGAQVADVQNNINQILVESGVLPATDAAQAEADTAPPTEPTDDATQADVPAEEEAATEQSEAPSSNESGGVDESATSDGTSDAAGTATVEQESTQDGPSA